MLVAHRSLRLIRSSHAARDSGDWECAISRVADFGCNGIGRQRHSRDRRPWCGGRSVGTFRHTSQDRGIGAQFNRAPRRLSRVFVAMTSRLMIAGAMTPGAMTPER